MPDTTNLRSLEIRRREIRQQLAAIGDLRPGSLTPRYRRCGKPYCHCADDDSKKHGPSWSLTHPVAGKTRTRVIPPQAVEQTRAQIAECRRFRKLAQEMIEVSDSICQLRMKADSPGRAAQKRGSAPRSRQKSAARSPPKPSD